MRTRKPFAFGRRCLTVLLLGCGWAAGCNKQPDEVVEKTPSPQTETPPGKKPSKSVADTPRALPPDHSRKRPELPVRAITRQEFNATWQIDVDIINRPLGEALKQLTEPVKDWNPEIVLAEGSAGKTTGDEKLLAAVLQRPVTVKAAGISRLEAIERACRAAGVVPDYESHRQFGKNAKSQIRLHRQPPPSGGLIKNAPQRTSPLDVQFTGPYRVQMMKLKQYAPQASGEIGIRIQRLELPKPLLELERFQPHQIDSITGTGGVDVKGRHLSGGFRGSDSLPFSEGTTTALRGLLRSVTSLETVTGHVKLSLPTKVLELWCDSVQPQSKYRDGPLELEIKTSSPNFVRFS